MKVLQDSLRSALVSLWAHRLRSFLTMLGVIIGVAAVIALVSIGEGARREVVGQIQGMGTDLVMVMARDVRLQADDARLIAQRVPGVAAASPVVSASLPVKRGNLSTDPDNPTIEGVWPEYAFIRNLSVTEGRFLRPEDEQGRRRVAVLGPTVVATLFESGSQAVGQTVSIAGQTFTVVGVLASRGQSLGTDNDNVVMVPLSAAQRLTGTTRIRSIWVKADSPDAGPTVRDLITSLLEDRYRREGVVMATSMEEAISVLGQAMNTLTLLLASIAGVSLVVGGIGIMNIMLVSVTERTREIGLRKALGAKRAHIVQQFLLEAVILSLIGGAVGIACGAAGAWGVSRLAGWPMALSLETVLLACLFAAAVGAFFGLFPALRAANQDPIRALRYE
ncbi:MAG: ABC transporter permease [Bacillota bacterium]